MAIQPVPPLVLASEFPTNADRTAGVWNAKATAWAGSENAMATRTHEISSVTWNNATEAFNSATAANQSKLDAESFKNQAQGYANSAGGSAAVVGRWDKLVLGPKSTPPTVDNDGQPLLEGAEYYNTNLKARYSWTGTAWAIGTNVTAGVSSVNGRAGAVTLSMADVAPGSVVAYGPDKASARAAIDASPDYSRGQLTITTSQTINKSIFGLATYVRYEMWGGGGSGGASVSVNAGSADRGGGEGGEYVSGVVRVSDMPESIQLVIGAGGASVTASAGSLLLDGNAGGDTSAFGIVAPGGLGASGSAGPAKVNLMGKNGGDGGGGPTSGGKSVNHPGGSSIFGGPGGGGSTSGATLGGTNSLGSAGGAGKVASATGDKAGDGVGPGAGGGGIRYNNSAGTATSGAGMRGEIRLSWW